MFEPLQKNCFDQSPFHSAFDPLAVMRIAFYLSAAILPPRGNNENNPHNNRFLRLFPSWPPLRRNNDFVYIIKYSGGPSAFQPNTTEGWVEQDLIEASSALPIVVTNSNIVNKSFFYSVCNSQKGKLCVYSSWIHTLQLYDHISF